MTLKGQDAASAHSYFRVIAMVDLAKPGYDSAIYELSAAKEDHNPLAYFYGEDGNGQVYADPYGKLLRVWPIERVLEAIEKDCERDGHYDRFNYALTLLRSVNELRERTSYNQLGVLLYGH